MMYPSENVRKALFLVGIMAGLYSFWCGFFSKRTDLPQWVLRVIGLIGVFGTLWGTLGIAASRWFISIGTHTVDLLDQYRTLSGGVCLGLFFAICVEKRIFSRLQTKDCVSKELKR